MAVLKCFVEIFELASLSWLHPSDLLTFTGSLRLTLLLQHTVLCRQLSILLLRQRQAQGNHEVLSEANLSNSLALKLFDSLGCLTGEEIPVAKLADIVGTPGVARAGAADHGSEAHSRDLKVLNVQHLSRLDTMRCVELPESALAPHVQLSISRQRR